jgi:tyrosinase
MPLLATPDQQRHTRMKHNRTSPLTFLDSPARRVLLLGTLLAASILVSCSQPARQRKNVKDLTPAERQDYVDAVLALKKTPSPYDNTLSWYDQFVMFHKQVYEYRLPVGEGTQDQREYQIGHESPSFLPWHRKFLLMYEQALREVSGKDISLPYWDWTDPASASIVFSEGFMGPGGVESDGYVVSSGPFSKHHWNITVFPKDEETGQVLETPYLVRKLGSENELPATSDMEACLKLNTYDVEPWDSTAPRTESFRNCLEGWGSNKQDGHLHNTAHVWVGGIFQDESGTLLKGSMALVDTSPNDPVFFLHHANVDRIWALWEQRHSNAYLPNGDGNPGWNPGDSLYPFNQEQYRYDSRVELYGNTVGDMLDMSKLDYEYR